MEVVVEVDTLHWVGEEKEEHIVIEEEVDTGGEVVVVRRDFADSTVKDLPADSRDNSDSLVASHSGGEVACSSVPLLLFQ